MKKKFFNVLTCIIISLIIFVIVRGDTNPLLNTDFYPEPDSVYAKYFPLIVGSKYTYLYTNYFPPQSNIFRATITKDTFIGNKKYFYCNNFPFVGTGWVRFDTASGNLLKRSTNGSCSIYPNDIILDSMKSKPNNQIYCTYPGTGFMMRRCLDTAIMTILGQNQKKTIEFLNDGLIYGKTRFARDFGIVSDCSGEPPPCQGFTNLKGCVINGILYGDTSLTNVKNISTNIPDKYSLSQNYPNPFNPTTNIKFKVESFKVVKLIVYDILGKEVSTLVNEKLQPGEYEVSFDAHSLPSGIYFYTLSTDDFKETKKMLMIK